MKDWLKTARKKSSFILYSLFLAIQRSEIGKRALFLFSKGVKLPLLNCTYLSSCNTNTSRLGYSYLSLSPKTYTMYIPFSSVCGGGGEKERGGGALRGRIARSWILPSFLNVQDSGSPIEIVHNLEIPGILKCNDHFQWLRPAQKPKVSKWARAWGL